MVIACLADGTNFKSMIIFRRKTKLKDHVPPGVLVHMFMRRVGWTKKECCYVTARCGSVVLDICLERRHV